MKRRNSMGDLQSEVRADNTDDRNSVAIPSQQKSSEPVTGERNHCVTFKSTVSDTIDQVIQQARLSQT